MNCPNCGTIINQGDLFCRVCGTKIPTQHNNLTSPNNVQKNIGNNNNINQDNPNHNNTTPNNNQYNNLNDDILIDSYIGTNAEQLKNGTFSFCSLLLGPIYVLYRKMWFVGLIWIVINVIINLFLSSISTLLLIIVNIVISTQFKKLYLKQVKEEVKEIQKDNTGASKEELIKICNQQGGTTIIPVIIIIVFYTLLMAIAFTAYKDEEEPNFNDNYDTTSNEYNQKKSKKSTGPQTIGELKVTIPEELKESKYSFDSHKKYALLDDEDYEICTFYIDYPTSSSYYNNDPEQYLKKSLYYSASDNYSGISEETINSNIWKTATITSDYWQKHYFTILKNNRLYKVEFSVEIENEQTCSKIYTEVINSLRFN